MKPKLLLLFLLVCSSLLFSQEYIFGKVSTDLGDKLPDAVIINMRTDEKIVSDRDGNFMIAAKNGDEIRVLKNTYERFVQKVSSENFLKPLNVTLSKAPYLIEEIELAFQATGNLKKDIQHYGDTKKTTKLKSETAKYIRSQSTEEVLAPKRGEFVQPLGKGFVVGKIDSHWDDVDFMQFLLENLGTEFFTQDLQLKPSEIQPFIYYIFRNFERQDILFKGFCNQYDLSRFISEANNKLVAYHQNLPNNPPIKRKRK